MKGPKVMKGCPLGDMKIIEMNMEPMQELAGPKGEMFDIGVMCRFQLCWTRHPKQHPKSSKSSLKYTELRLDLEDKCIHPDTSMDLWTQRRIVASCFAE